MHFSSFVYLKPALETFRSVAGQIGELTSYKYKSFFSFPLLILSLVIQMIDFQTIYKYFQSHLTVFFVLHKALFVF